MSERLAYPPCACCCPSKTNGIVVDLLFASSGIEPELAAAETPLDVLPDLVVPVATLGHLVALKLLAMDDAPRPQDRIDILSLLQHADDVELRRAEEAITTITARGFHREKDMPARLRDMLATRTR
jgi:hypothetical protein